MLEKILESPLDCKEIKPVNHKRNQLWICIGRTDAEAPVKLATWWDMTHWKIPWCWERLRVGGEGGDGLDGWMASMIQWTWVWANSWRQWRTGMPGVLQSMGLQKSQTQLSDWTTTVWLRELYSVLCGDREGICVYLWLSHFDVQQKQYNFVKQLHANKN